MRSVLSTLRNSRTVQLGSIAIMLGAFALTSPDAYAKRASKAIMTVTQPDGTQLKIQKFGDEYSHYITTDDGIPLINVDGQYFYATLNDDNSVSASSLRAMPAELRSSEHKSFIAKMDINDIKSIMQSTQSPNRVRPQGIIPGQKATRGPGLCTTTFPSKGEQKGLVILVDFPDKKFETQNPKEYFTRLLNEEGFSDYGATGSAREWFVENSMGQFHPQFDVYGPVTMPQKMSYYGGNDRYGNDKAPEKMVVTACEKLDGEIDFTVYDRDNNHQVDNVYIFYAGYGEADYDDANTIWPHSWDLSESSTISPLLDGCILEHYACSNEIDGQNHRPDGIGTFVHEFSHVMGLPDLYYTGSSNRNQPYTPGEYSVLDYGPYNNAGRTPPNYSTYERYALDWITPDQLIETGDYELINLADSNKAFIVKTEREQEYFLFENRQQTGNDKYIPGHGMLVWHIDVEQSKFDNNEVNNSNSHQYVDIVEADGTQRESDANGDVFPGPLNRTEFTDTTRPKFESWSGKSTGLGLYKITETEDGKITFQANVKGTESVDNIQMVNAPYLEGLTLHLNNTTGQVSVYDITGCLTAVSAGEDIELPSAGLYIVVINGATYKFLAK
ncbi:MAG: M6 family metalloprotease domain-containing protein [Prevotella sp.]|nr:M6 family metalloprotease domain-containing protein [Bacteroides sp.]MCM1366285.1 M6 family metalloprotease domain-containing protein [Prevotella sp.]MCM1437089.1 M6 family metalloprotease domain-containing protein [Prevotella sp.]